MLSAILAIIQVAFNPPALPAVWVMAQASDPPVEQSQPIESKDNEESTKTNASIDQPTVDRANSEATDTSSESAGPYDIEAIKAFNRALYGS